jgi:D-galacturonate reductase
MFVYRSFEEFIDAVNAINNGQAKWSDFDEVLATLNTTLRTTAILQAGRLSLDHHNRPVQLLYEDATHPCEPTNLQVV